MCVNAGLRKGCDVVRFVDTALRRGCVASMLICVESNMVCERWLAKKMQRVNAGMCKNCSHCVEAVFARNLIVGALLLLPENGLHAMGDDSGAGEGGGVAKMNYSSHWRGGHRFDMIYQYLVPSRLFKLTPLLRKPNSS